MCLCDFSSLLFHMHVARKVKIRKGLSEIQTFERETASFEVELTHSNVEGTWLKDGNRLKSNNHCRMTTNGNVHSLTIANLSLEDTGTYTFSTENAKSAARLTVKGKYTDYNKSQYVGVA